MKPLALENTPMLSNGGADFDSSRLSLLKNKAKKPPPSKPPAAALDSQQLRVNSRVEARFDNGEYYSARVTRADAAKGVFSVEFVDDGIRRDGLTMDALRPCA
uniref:Tudor domain-containing protein n=1 Tax=Prymnesium polylepis TaxID=72548 RepID=A0A7S4HEJ8_9EUKA